MATGMTSFVAHLQQLFARVIGGVNPADPGSRPLPAIWTTRPRRRATVRLGGRRSRCRALLVRTRFGGARFSGPLRGSSPFVA